jgi:membrane protease YdiL (CAAX protease family)
VTTAPGDDARAGPQALPGKRDRAPCGTMLTALHHAMITLRSIAHRLILERDPLLLQGRERRWRWPWAIIGTIVTAFLFFLLTSAVIAFETLAQQRRWIVGGFPQNVFPIDPAKPLTYLDLVLTSLPFLLAPLIVLPLVHGVSWRRAFSYGVGFQWRQFFNAATALMVVAVLGVALSYVLEPKQFEFPALDRAIPLWIALALGVILVQSLGEEVLFRGYLLRVWGAVLPYRVPVTASVISLFVAGHLGNEDIKRDLLLNLVYFVAVEVISYAVLFRTQNLAASAGLHWMNNVMALLTPTVPGQPTALALAVYTDPVYAAGGSRLFDPITHAGTLAGVVILLVLLLWRRSPFYLARQSLSARD